MRFAQTGCVTFGRLILASAVSVAPLLTACEGSPSTADAGTDAAGEDAGEDAGECLPTTAPTARPSRRSVTFRVSGVGFLATAPPLDSWWHESCETFSIAGESGYVERLEPLVCHCECAAPPMLGTPGGYVALGTYEFSWDASGLERYATQIDCYFEGCRPSERWVRQPVPGGRYTLTLLVEDELPESCHATDSENVYACDAPAPVSPTYPLAPVRQCRATRTVEVEFDLPASGDMVIDVVVPPPDA